MTRKLFANQRGLTSESFDYWCKKQYNEVVKVDRPTTALYKSQLAMLGFIELIPDFDYTAQKNHINRIIRSKYITKEDEKGNKNR